MTSEPTHSPDTTRARILQAATEAFARDGFAHATIRGIVDAAGANIAAVNYHFGGKAELYSAVFDAAAQMGFERYPIDMDLPADPTPRDRLFAFVRSFFYRAFANEGVGSHLGRLLLRELVEPTPELPRRVQLTVRPMANYLADTIVGIVGRPLSEEERFLAVTSVISQILFHKHCREALRLLFPNRTYTTEELERLAAHVTTFSIAGLHGAFGQPQR